MPGLFPTLPGLTADERNRGDIRPFTGDGTPFLKLPGLKRLESVRVGTVELPEYTSQEFQDNTRPYGYGTITSRVPMYQLISDPEGTPILVRSVQSNDGVWQNGAVIYIAGEWEPEKEKPASGKKPATSNTGNAGNTGANGTANDSTTSNAGGSGAGNGSGS